VGVNDEPRSSLFELEREESWRPVRLRHYVRAIAVGIQEKRRRLVQRGETRICRMLNKPFYFFSFGKSDDRYKMGPRH